MIKQVFNDSAKNIYDDFIKKMSNYFSLKSHNHTLISLTDVDLSGATQGDYISYDNGIWVPTSGSSSDLSNYYTKQQSNENFLSGNTTISDLDGYTIDQLDDLLTGKTDLSLFDSHTGNTTIHYLKSSINITDLGVSAHTHLMSDITDLNIDLSNYYTKSEVYNTGETYTQTQINNSFLSLSGGTLVGSLTANTYYGDGSQLTGIGGSFSPTNIIYVDSNATGGNGTIGKPFDSTTDIVEVVVSFTGNTTLNNATITTIADTSAINVGDIVGGIGISWESRVLSKTLDSINLDKVCTANGTTIALKSITPKKVIVTGNHTITANCERMNVVEWDFQNSNIQWGNLDLWGISVIRIANLSIIGGNFNGTHAGSRVLNNTVIHNTKFTLGFYFNSVKSINTGYLFYCPFAARLDRFSINSINGISSNGYLVSTWGYTLNLSGNIDCLLGGALCGEPVSLKSNANITVPIALTAIDNTTTVSHSEISGIITGIVKLRYGTCVARINGEYWSYGSVVHLIDYGATKIRCKEGATELHGSLVNPNNELYVEGGLCLNYGFINCVYVISGGLLENYGNIGYSFVYNSMTNSAKIINHGTLNLGYSLTLNNSAIIENRGYMISNHNYSGANYFCLQLLNTSKFYNYGFIESTNNFAILPLIILNGGTFINWGGRIKTANGKSAFKCSAASDIKVDGMRVNNEVFADDYATGFIPTSTEDFNDYKIITYL